MSVATRIILRLVVLMILMPAIAFVPNYGLRFSLFTGLAFLHFSGIYWTLFNRPVFLIVSMALFSVLAFGPVDILITHQYKKPRLVPVFAGYATKEILDANARGEVFLLPCYASENAPKLIVIW